MSYMHIFYGHDKRKRERGEKCWICGAKPDMLAHNYFGAPYCKDCWENHWLNQEDAQGDPHFDDINREVSGEYINLSDEDTQHDA